VFMWLVEQKGILTKDNMTRRRWQGDTGCYLCGQLESCDHLLFDCPISKVVWGVDAYCFHQRTRPLSYGQFWHWVEKALPGGGGDSMLGLAVICWAIWKTRNSICFDKKVLKSLVQILYTACAFMNYWAGLYPEESQKVLKELI
jgi:hypothetical protein